MELKEWLEKTAEKQRTAPVKKDCAVLMEYLDKFDTVSYLYKPAIMLKDGSKGYIPDILIQLPGDVKLILDFIHKDSKYYDKDQLRQKAYDLETEGFLHRYAPKGLLSGKDAVSVDMFMLSIADSFKENVS